MSIKFSARPSRYGFGPHLSIGQIDVQELEDGTGFTVTRLINDEMWAPVSGPDNPVWLMWNTVTEAAAWVHLARPVKDYPHWGAVLS